jgi:hypothetical protein
MDQTAILLDRAYRAFVGRSANAGHLHGLTPTVRVLGRLRYVVLQDGHAVLAVYRVRKNGALRRMKRWPLALGSANASLSATDHAYSI